jgi:hypothetical protein
MGAKVTYWLSGSHQAGFNDWQLVESQRKGDLA